MAVQPQDQRRYTIEEFEQLPEEDLHKLELVRGKLVREPRPGIPHARAQVVLGHLLESYVRPHRLGYVLSDVGVIIEREPGTVRGPDLAFVRKDRFPYGLPERGFAGFVPDLCVEIVSPSNTRREIAEKVDEYLAGGARLVWAVDPRLRTVTEHRSGAPVRALTSADELTGHDALPGFRIRVSELFEE
ncbi:MAG: Uma2 family endonuclease [Longimicrobiales bacterium]